MKLNTLFFVFCILLTACGGSGVTAVKPEIDVEIINQSSRLLENALARFGDYTCEWGYVGKTFSKSYLYYPHPITVQTELSWSEEGKPRVEKLDLKAIYSSGKSGRLTFTVHDDHVETSFVEKN